MEFNSVYIAESHVISQTSFRTTLAAEHFFYQVHQVEPRHNSLGTGEISCVIMKGNVSEISTVIKFPLPPTRKDSPITYFTT